MKKTVVWALAAILVGFAAMSFTTSESEGEGHGSSIIWVGKKVTGQHSGTINFKTVDLTFDQKNVMTAASFEVDMTSIKCTDLDADMAPKLEGHLKSADFFAVEKHPLATFVSTSVEHKGSNQYMVKGDLTIKGITNPIEFRATASSANGHKSASAELIVDRSKYDVKYNSGSFFEGLGDKLIYDDFNLKINVHAH